MKVKIPVLDDVCQERFLAKQICLTDVLVRNQLTKCQTTATKGFINKDTDRDNDRIISSVEIAHKLDPDKKDTDGDGLQDGDEFYGTRDFPNVGNLDIIGCDPTRKDTDENGKTDLDDLNYEFSQRHRDGYDKLYCLHHDHDRDGDAWNATNVFFRDCDDRNENIGPSAKAKAKDGKNTHCDASPDFMWERLVLPQAHEAQPLTYYDIIIHVTGFPWQENHYLQIIPKQDDSYYNEARVQFDNQKKVTCTDATRSIAERCNKLPWQSLKAKTDLIKWPDLTWNTAFLYSFEEANWASHTTQSGIHDGRERDPEALACNYQDITAACTVNFEHPSFGDCFKERKRLVLGKGERKYLCNFKKYDHYNRDNEYFQQYLVIERSTDGRQYTMSAQFTTYRRRENYNYPEPFTNPPTAPTEVSVKLGD